MSKQETGAGRTWIEGHAAIEGDADARFGAGRRVLDRRRRPSRRLRHAAPERCRSLLRLGAWVAALLASAPVAGASDGVLEINQSCAVATGCFAGDTAGFPVTISTSGSYRLSSNLVVPDATTGALQIDASHVDVNLGGFALKGPVTCTGSGASLVCSPDTGGLTPGIRSSASANVVSIANGAVSGMGSSGIQLNGRQNRIEDVRADWNLVAGIFVGSDSMISGSSAQYNDGIGIVAGPGTVVADSTSARNADFGIIVLDAGIVRGSMASSNASTGILVGSGSLVQANTSKGNAGVGISLGANSGYRENVVSNNGGAEVSGGINLGNNACDGVVCP